MTDTVLERETITKPKVKIPSKYNVVFHNDDSTPFDFVIQLICEVFEKSVDEATELTMKVHHDNAAIIAVYTKEIAEHKKEICIVTSRSHGYNLMVTIEPE